MLRAMVVSVAVCAVACSGELREIKPVSPETPTACEVASPSAMLATAPMVSHDLDSAHVRVLADVDAGCATEALGVVDALLGDDEPRAMELLKANAAKLGADVVLEARRATDGGMPRLVGTAARCREVRSSRPYDVLERIDIPGVSGGAQAAFAQLRARAWDLNADVVLDVRLEEDGTERTHIRGTAVRYR
jgi:uncharacterized protein YbjQ (UPF0145 family)